MYINEVVRRAREYCPSEYTDEEMYQWCDEVSSMLMIEDRNVFVRGSFSVGSDGRLALPDGVEAENIVSVTVGTKTLDKDSVLRGTVSLTDGAKADVVYFMPYTPVRLVSYTGVMSIDSEDSCIVLASNEFQRGDLINIKAGDINTEASVIRTDGCRIYLPADTVSNLSDTDNAQISRVVTEKTVCDAPYDGMYIDYIIAKICMYQRDFNTYNQFMTAFNSRLDAYKRWITNRLPQSGGSLKNWW